MVCASKGSGGVELVASRCLPPSALGSVRISAQNRRMLRTGCKNAGDTCERGEYTGAPRQPSVTGLVVRGRTERVSGVTPSSGLIIIWGKRPCAAKSDDQIMNTRKVVNTPRWLLCACCAVRQPQFCLRTCGGHNTSPLCSASVALPPHPRPLDSMIGMKRVCAAGVRRAFAQAPPARFAAATVPVPHQAWFHAHTSVAPAAAQHAASTWMSRASGMHSASARATFCTSSGEQAKEASEDEAAAGDAATGEQTEQEASQAEPTVEERLAQCEEEVKELAATRLRLLAEMENVRSIARNDVERAKKFAAKVRHLLALCALLLCLPPLWCLCGPHLRVVAVLTGMVARRASRRACLASRTTWSVPWPVSPLTHAASLATRCSATCSRACR